MDVNKLTHSDHGRYGERERCPCCYGVGQIASPKMSEALRGKKIPCPICRGSK